MRIAVLMTCHNRREKTLRCLRALAVAAKEVERKGGGGQWNLHVFLVDDGSTDGTGEAVRNVGMWECENEEMGKCGNGEKSEWVKVIRGDGKLFWAKGMALAWETAVDAEERCGPFDFFLWLNDDVGIKSGAIVSVVEDWRACGDERGVVVGACSKDVAESESSYAATTRHDVQIPPNGNTPQRADGWFNGNFVLVPRKAYEQVGMLSREYTHARADYDYAERLKRAGIPFFASSHYVGVCVKDYAQKVKGMGLGKRVSLLWKPSYCNLHDLFLFKRKYYGLLRAVVACLHMMIIVLRPLGR